METRKLDRIFETKLLYKTISQKIPSIRTSSKYYWSLLKRKLNDKKIPVIPLLFHNSKRVTNV